MKRKQSKVMIFGLIASGVLTVAIGLAIFGLTQTVHEIGNAMIAREPEAILASAGVAENENVFLTVTYFDQKSDECVNLYDGDKQALATRQFEWSECGYRKKSIEQGLVNSELGDNGLPTGKNGKTITNQGMGDLTRWFEEVDGKSKKYTGSLKLDYQSDGAIFNFNQKNFYPLDEIEFSSGDTVNKDGHNHLFTMNFAVPFTVLSDGDEKFEVVADDDTFVFVDDTLVLDMGGIHGAMTGQFEIRENGEIYASVNGEDMAYSGVTVEEGTAQSVRVFHADRDSSESTFSIKTTGMNLNVTSDKLANRQEDGLQIAYDPTNSTYVAPLGETSVVEPDNTKGYVIMATIEGIMIAVFAILLIVSLKHLIR